MKSELLVCACSRSLASAGSRDSAGSRRSRREESLLCSPAVIEFGAAGEFSTAAMGLLYGDRQLCCTTSI